MSYRNRERNRAAYSALLRAQIDVALRGGNIRFSPHLYNTSAEIDRAVEVLLKLG